MIEEKVSKDEGGLPVQTRTNEGWGAQSEEEILTQVFVFLIQKKTTYMVVSGLIPR